MPQETSSSYTPWPQFHRNGLAPTNAEIRPLYERTRRFRNYTSTVVSGALQTADYTRAILRAISDWDGLPDDVEEAVAIRVERQNFLHDGQHQYDILIEEFVLRNPIGGPEVMLGQLQHLLDALALDSVQLGIIPVGVSRSARWPKEGFWLYDDVQASSELIGGYLQITDPDQIAVYARTFDDLSALAVHDASAAGLIDNAIKALQT